jgi:chorismate synthase
MSNSFGTLFRFTSWGESHGPAIGAVIDGMPPNIPIDLATDIQPFLDKRRPAKNRYVTQRKEEDKVEALSGLFEGKTLGSPISLIIYNQDQRSQDYSNIKNKFRPGHAELSYFAKYGHYDYRGGGRASARETATRVAVGAFARKIIPEVKIFSQIIQIGQVKSTIIAQNAEEIQDEIWQTTDPGAITKWENLLTETRKKGDSVGGQILITAKNVAAGLGEPLYNKLSAAIASAMFSIPAVKAIEIGSGNNALNLYGSEHNDQVNSNLNNKQIKFYSNNNGGTLGGISTGQDLNVTITIKPTSSTLKKMHTIDKEFKNCEIDKVTGRHDPCIALRATHVAEAMLAIVLADFHLLQNRFN